MNIENVSLEELLALHESKESPLRISFRGRDLADFYFVVDTKHHSEEESQFWFLFYLDDEQDGPCEALRCDSMTDAVMHLSYRFILDNCDQENDTAARDQEMLRQLTTYS